MNALAIPATLHNSLMARLDRLQPVKEVAQIASIIGRSFEHETIEALAGMPEPELVEAMRKLVEAELVFAAGRRQMPTYLFKHAFVRDAAYESMLKSRCKSCTSACSAFCRMARLTPRSSPNTPKRGAIPARRSAGGTKPARRPSAVWPSPRQRRTSIVRRRSCRRSVTMRTASCRGASRSLVQLSLVRYGYGHERTKALYARADALAQTPTIRRLLMLARYGAWAVYHVRENVVVRWPLPRNA